MNDRHLRDLRDVTIGFRAKKDFGTFCKYKFKGFYRNTKRINIALFALLVLGSGVHFDGAAGASVHRLTLRTSTCADYDRASESQKIKFVKSWDHELTVVSGNEYLTTGLGVMQNYCLPGGEINSDNESIGKLLFDAALIG